MFHRILVPLDGSQRAEQVLPVAGQLARVSQGTLVLVRAVSPILIPMIYPEVVEARQRAIEAEAQVARRYLEHVANLTSISGVHVETEMIEENAATAILSVAEAQRIDLIVPCSHGYTGMERWMLGSVAEKVVRHAPVPVLLLHEGGPTLVETPFSATTAIHAFVPLDGSERAKVAILPAVQLMSAFALPAARSLQITLAVVMPINRQMQPDERGHLVQHMREYLHTTVEQTRSALIESLPGNLTCSVSSIVTSDEDIAEGIIRLVEECQDTEEPGRESTELIAMTTHGYGGLQRWMLGSITERVVHTTKLPMLIVRPMNRAYEGGDILKEAEVPIF